MSTAADPAPESTPASASVSSNFAVNGDVRIHWLDSGGEDGRPPILFVPGLTDVAEDYLEVLPTFGRRTIVVDLRGRGRSDTPDVGYSTADHAGDVEAVASAATDGPVHLVTFSRGTCYGLTWAFDNADRVRSVAIGDYPAREIESPPDVADLLLGGRWRGTPVVERVREHALRSLFAESVPKPFWPDLATLRVPVLAVRCGKGHGPINDDDWARYRAEIDGIEQHVFVDSPHDIFRPDRHRFPQLVRDQIESADARR